MARSDSNEQFDRTSFLYGANAHYIEEMLARFAEDPQGVDPEWRAFFSEMGDDPRLAATAARGASWQRADWPLAVNGELVSALDGNWPLMEKTVAPRLAEKARSQGVSLDAAELRKATLDSVRALMMIRAYRIRGHLAAELDPLRLRELEAHPELDPVSYGFGPQDMNRPIFIDKVLGLERATITEMLEVLKRTYCSTMGVEFMHISDPAQKGWVQERIEGPEKTISFTEFGKKAILAKLIAAEGFEHFLNVKYTGTKRFGLDGGESMIPALEQIIKRGGALGMKEIVLGMAHRGRLNVLANVMGKPYSAIFHEFKGGSSTPDEVEGSGDVKYHLGTSSDRTFDGNNVHLSLTANPSHLEIVVPVVLGKARAKQDQLARRDPLQRPAAAHPRRCRLRRPGGDRGMLRAVRLARPSLGWRRPLHRQQPDRLHHQPHLGALLALPLGCGQDDRGAHPARQRRRSRSGGLCRQGGHRVPPKIPQTGGHRHVLLPALRP